MNSRLNKPRYLLISTAAVLAVGTLSIGACTSSKAVKESSVPFERVYAPVSAIPANLSSITRTIDSESGLYEFTSLYATSAGSSPLAEIDFDRQILLVFVYRTPRFLQLRDVTTSGEGLVIVLTHTERSIETCPVVLHNPVVSLAAIYLAIDRPDVWPVPLNYRIEELIEDCET